MMCSFQLIYMPSAARALVNLSPTNCCAETRVAVIPKTRSNDSFSFIFILTFYFVMIYITSDFAIAGVKELTARFKKVADSDKAFLNLILQ